MVKNKFYAVKRGKRTGIYRTWRECQENVLKVKGCQYKCFENKEAASKYLEDQKT